MKNKVSPAVALGAVVVLLVMVAVIGFKIFAREAGPTKPPPEKLAEIARQQQMMSHYTPSPQSSPGPAGMQNSQQQQQQMQQMQQYQKNQQGQH